MAFSASEAAFEGFRIARREPLSIAAWAVLQLIFGIAITAAFLPAMRDFMAFAPGSGSPTGAPSTFAATGLLRDLGMIYLVLLPLEIVLFSVLGAAIYRAVLRPEDKGLGRLELGGDELRLLGLWLLLGFLWLVVFAGTIIVFHLIADAAVRGSGSGTGWAGLLGVVVYLGSFLAYFWAAVRLSLAGPMTFAQRRIRLFGAWKLTKGRFWSLFGCYLLAFVFAMLIMMVEFAVVAAVTLAFSGGSLMAVASTTMRPDFSSYAAYFSVGRVVALLAAAPCSAVLWAVLIAPSAAAYKEIAGAGSGGSADARA